MTTQETDELYMSRCLQLASMAEGHTYPNPMVGAVIVHNNKIIGEGYHRKAGEPHAEVNAVNSVKDQSLLEESTIYVSLEPCSHFGKTPPCSLLILEKKIPRVVVGCIDTFSEVGGKGIAMLRQAGVNVKVGILENECREINRRFFTYFEKKRPFVILKWAQTIDGFIDIDRDEAKWGEPTWITNQAALRDVHRMRTREQAILVGYRTALKDNPSLTVRYWAGNQPLRIVMDRDACLPDTLRLFDRQNPTLIVTQKKIESCNNINCLTLAYNDHLIPELLRHLYTIGIQSVIIEGGTNTLTQFIDAELWDEAHVYVGEKCFIQGIKAPGIKGNIVSISHFDESKLFVYRPK